MRFFQHFRKRSRASQAGARLLSGCRSVKGVVIFPLIPLA
jgi:hypothetical protein